MDIIKDASETIFKRLVWHTAKRDQAGIVQKLTNEQEVQEIYGLGDAGFYGELGSGSHENRNDFRSNPINDSVDLVRFHEKATFCYQ